jgi:hypothetical protein
MKSVSKSLQKTLPFLNVVSKLSNENRKRVLKEVGGEKHIYNALHEIAYNTLKGNIKLDKSQSKKLIRHKKLLENLCKNNKCAKKRSKLIVQSGGFLPFLIPALASIISAVISRNA